MRPGRPLLWLLVLLALLGGAVVLGHVPVWGWYLAGGGIVLLAVLDAALTRWQVLPRIQRELPEALPLGVEREVTLSLEGVGRQWVEVFDLHPEGWPMQGLPRKLKLDARTISSIAYRLRPIARGDFLFEGVQVRISSPLRLWRRSRIVGERKQVQVCPNFAPLTRFALFSADQASRLVGAHLKRRRGEGTDFHQMREYRAGDSMRQIDWKATARSRKLISREYQDEKNQQLVMLLDTGRRMMAREDGYAHFDHVLDASLVVSYLALRRGDAVGMLAGGENSRWVAPQRGMGSLDRLLRASYDLQPQPVATDYLDMATGLALHQRRRALVMLVTNVRDEDIEDLLGAVRLLQKRHLVCVASLRERALDAALASEVVDLPDAIRAGAVAHYLQQRNAAHEALRRHRVMTLDVASADLPAALVERYLSVKRDGLL
ncbi:MAG: DUF58 domain-containing protein [Xanthomonadaceae bacterium]|jgi:uncharacterized protein (DUF58 family)|nr:DUF58 domain-containing protein [Xanthomonadaceae bacterium]